MSDSNGHINTGSQEPPAEIPREATSYSGIDRILEILSIRHRRLILLSLKTGGVKTEADVMTRSRKGTDDMRIALEHQHLPKIADAGYIEWDREAGEISKGPRFDEVEPILELIEKHADELPPDWP